eukprot:tig00000498_g1661.t1
MRALAALLLLAAVSGALGAQFFASRYATHPCSLRGTDDNDSSEPAVRACQLISSAGTGFKNALKLRFGETNCTVTLRRCKPGVCYPLWDYAGRNATDQVERPLPTSIFSQIAPVSGASIKWTKRGLAIVPTASTVTFAYSTHTCAAYYGIRGRSTTQLCSNPFDAISQIEPGVPFPDCPATWTFARWFANT